jgi:hypothetical protein
MSRRFQYRRRTDLVAVGRPSNNLVVVERRRRRRPRPGRVTVLPPQVRNQVIIQGLPTGGGYDSRLELVAAALRFTAQRRFGRRR